MLLRANANCMLHHKTDAIIVTVHKIHEVCQRELYVFNRITYSFATTIILWGRTAD